MNPRHTPPPRFDKRRALSDIDGFAARVPGFDPSRYHDQQTRRALGDAVARWPALARMLELADRAAGSGNAVRMVTASRLPAAGRAEWLAHAEISSSC